MHQHKLDHIADQSQRWDSNPQPAVYKTAALPIELHWQATAAKNKLHRSTLIDRKKTAPANCPRPHLNDSGNNLLSHLSALSSALATLTIEFGMDRVYATRYGHRKFRE